MSLRPKSEDVLRWHLNSAVAAIEVWWHIERLCVEPQSGPLGQ